MQSALVVILQKKLMYSLQNPKMYSNEINDKKRTVLSLQNKIKTIGLNKKKDSLKFWNEGKLEIPKKKKKNLKV